MSCDLVALCFAAHDPVALARFWGRLLGWHPLEVRDGGIDLVPTDGTAYRLRFVAGQQPKVSANRVHLDLTSASPEQQDDTVARALGLGARHIDVGQLPEEGQVVLADPEGNELCVIEAGNGFLDGCGTIGAINCDGTQAVGYFWSEALGWPLVWDQDEETAIQSPRGGSKIAWGGPPVAPKTGQERLHLDIAPRDGTALEAEVDRLLSLGATPVDIGQGRVDWVVLADPDGNEFCVRPG
ncbi:MULTISPECIES: VOC family protein [unclassified Nocardioides]|uniref:VOC family protein n=1 Tax=unclassified Nocardioides TaxID=2615069 RepID=UPI0036163E3D